MTEIENCEDFCDFAPIEQCMVKEKHMMSLEAEIKLRDMRITDPERVKANNKRWRKNNPEKVRAQARKTYERVSLDPVRLAKRRNTFNEWYKKKYHTDEEWRKMRGEKSKAYYRRKQLD